MSIFSRLSDIIASNLNALLDRVENPEALLVQVIREMEEGLAAARRYAALAIAAERRIGRELEQNRAEAERWQNKAREALAAERDDLARRALIRKREHEDLVRGLETQCAATGKWNGKEEAGREQRTIHNRQFTMNKALARSPLFVNRERSIARAVTPEVAAW